MKFLTFNNFFDNNIHINKLKNFKKFDTSLYKIIKNSCIINLTYTSIYLYKLYKIFAILSLKNIYVSFINKFNKDDDEKPINLLLKFTKHNIFNSKYWIKGIVINENSLTNIIILGLWLNKFFLNNSNFIVPFSILKMKDKIEYICSNLKFKNFSKFVFIFNVEMDKYPLKECIKSNKFIIGICNFNFNIDILDFFIYGDSSNEIFLDFIIKFIIVSCINSKFL